MPQLAHLASLYDGTASPATAALRPGGTGPSPNHDDDEVGVFSERRRQLLRYSATGQKALARLCADEPMTDRRKALLSASAAGRAILRSKSKR